MYDDFLMYPPLGNYTLEIGAMERRGFKIFDFDYPFYNPSHKPEFERKFLLKFRYHEIGQETIQRFKYMLQEVLTTNYPKYKHHWDTFQELKASGQRWYYNKDYVTEYERKMDSSGNINSNNSSSDNSKGSYRDESDNTTDNTNKFLDTPMGELNNILPDLTPDKGYLTNMTTDHNESLTVNEGENENTLTSNSNGVTNSTNNLGETVVTKEYGNIGVVSQANLVKAQLEVFEDIDRMIFEDCEKEGLFMMVY